MAIPCFFLVVSSSTRETHLFALKGYLCSRRVRGLGAAFRGKVQAFSRVRLAELPPGSECIEFASKRPVGPQNGFGLV